MKTIYLSDVEELYLESILIDQYNYWSAVSNDPATPFEMYHFAKRKLKIIIAILNQYEEELI